MRVESDIDILVVRESPTSSATWDGQLMRLAGEVTTWTGNAGNILDLARDQIHADDDVLAEVERDGLTVFGSAAWFRRTRRRPAS